MFNVIKIAMNILWLFVLAMFVFTNDQSALIMLIIGTPVMVVLNLWTLEA